MCIKDNCSFLVYRVIHWVKPTRYILENIDYYLYLSLLINRRKLAYYSICGFFNKVLQTCVRVKLCSVRYHQPRPMVHIFTSFQLCQ